MLPRDDVARAFEIVLGRLPEDDAAFAYHSAFASLSQLSEHLFATQEFRDRAMPLLYGRNKPCWVATEISGSLRLWLDLNDRGVSVHCLNDNYEPAVTAFVLSQLKPGDLFVDVGANIGWFTVLAAWIVSSLGHVCAFEPVLDTFAYLQRSVMENGFGARCQLFPVALGATPRMSHIAIHPEQHNRGHAYLADSAVPENGAHPAAMRQIEIRRLDDIRLPRRISLMKIDVEGAEDLVMQGALRTIARDRPIIVSEVFPHWLKRISGVTVDDFIGRMSTLGYQPYLMAPSGRCVPYEMSEQDQASQDFYATLAFLTTQQSAHILGNE